MRQSQFVGLLGKSIHIYGSRSAAMADFSSHILVTQRGDAGETKVIYMCHDIPAQNHFTVDVDIKGDSTGCGRYVY